jgi:GTP cyclohydrolase FolE2
MADSRDLLTQDLQGSPAEIQIGLSRAGVTGVQKAIRLR